MKSPPDFWPPILERRIYAASELRKLVMRNQDLLSLLGELGEDVQATKNVELQHRGEPSQYLLRRNAFL